MKKIFILLVALIAFAGCSKDEKIEYRTPEYINTRTLIHTEIAQADNYCIYDYQWTVGEPYKVFSEYPNGYYPFKEGYSEKETTKCYSTGYYYREPVDVYANYSYEYCLNDKQLTWDMGDDAYLATGGIYGTVNKGDVITIYEIKEAFE